MSTKLRWRRPSIAFGAKLKTNGGVGLFYFSGHGAQIGGENYLIPVSVNDAAEVETGSVTATQIRQRHGRRT